MALTKQSDNVDKKQGRPDSRSPLGKTYAHGRIDKV